jgi:hypothetical protein
MAIIITIMNGNSIINITCDVPPAFVTVLVLLDDGRSILAVWTGRFWWGEHRELSVKAWCPFSTTKGTEAVLAAA